MKCISFITPRTTIWCLFESLSIRLIFIWMTFILFSTWSRFMRELNIYIVLYISCNRLILSFDFQWSYHYSFSVVNYRSKPQVNVVIKNNFQMGLDKIVQSKHISLDEKEETVLSQSLNVLKFPVLLIFAVTQAFCFSLF